jgi:hypothetical protein
MQLAVVAFASATVFVRARSHTASVEDGRTFLSYLFYSIYFMNASAWSELSITVRPQVLPFQTHPLIPFLPA